MRTLIAILIPALAAAASAAAQPAAPPPAALQPYIDLQRDRDARTVGRMEAAKEHDTALRNDLTTLQATQQTRQVLSDINAAGARPVIPSVKVNPNAPAVHLDLDQFAQIPDATLAASNARAVAAAQNKR